MPNDVHGVIAPDDAIIATEAKRIEGDIFWGSDQNTLSMRFRTDISSDGGYPLFLQGWYNPYSGKLSYAMIYRGVGRIYGLDLGAAHINPEGAAVGETHKNHWVPGHRDRWAYAPGEITPPGAARWRCGRSSALKQISNTGV